MKLNFKVLALSLGLMGGSIFASANENAPLWLRNSVISPDGNTIAFTYKGDIFTVPSQGGKANQLTTNPAYDTKPIWSPDGSKIAFVSDRLGSKDIYIVNSIGGEPTRLTTHSGNENIITFKDNNTILFSANVMPSAESTQFPGGFNQVYSVETQEGSRPVMFSTLPLEDIAFYNNGKSFLYHDFKGYEDPLRKHQTSSIARDIWRCEISESGAIKDSKFTKITAFDGEDRSPVISPDGQHFYYLSEMDGTFNIYMAPITSGENSLDSKDDVKQITSMEKNPSRFLSVANNGTICFGYDGEIYTLKEGGEPTKVNIDIITDKVNRDIIKQTFRDRGASDMAVSKDGKQIAYIYRGDVFVSNTKFGTSKRITNTAEQERDIDFAPDGRSIIYSSERNGLWQVYQASIVEKDEDDFSYATEIEEENITNSESVSFQALYSPDGKEVAFLENRTAIRVVNLKSKKVRTVMDAKYAYSYSDGDQWYRWSPDGKWIVTNSIFNLGWNNPDIALLDASGNGVMHNLTQSGYSDNSPKWVLGGKAMIWKSDRAGFRSHGSWGSEQDVYIMFFDVEAYDKFMMNEEVRALYDKENKDKDEDKKEDKKDDDKKKKKEKVEDLVLDLENAKYRIMRLTVHSSKMGDMVLSKDGKKLFYNSSFEGPADLWMHDLEKGITKILVKGIGFGSLTLSDDGSSIYFNNQSGLKKIDPNTGSSKAISYNGEFEYKPTEERTYIFDHTWRQAKEKFYQKDLHGVDWDAYYDIYKKHLAHINNDADFAEMLSELLGELNASHTGARSYSRNSIIPTASFGVFFDESYQGDGLKIKEIIKRSVFDITNSGVTEGCIIESINDEPILAGKDYYTMLEGKAGKLTRVGIYNPKTKKRFEVRIKPNSTGRINQLLYERWVERNRAMVDKLSDGKIGYVHIKGMDSESFRVVYSDLLGLNREKDAVVVDTRNNGGGWLHDDIVTLLSGEQYAKFIPRDQHIGNDPFNKWLKPSSMLVCENNYSNAHGTPWVYQTLGIGKLVGAPVPGTMTAVWWETQINGSIVFGIPQVGCVDMDGNYLENFELQPDVLIYNRPEYIMNNKDAQIEEAVKVLQ